MKRLCCYCVFDVDEPVRSAVCSLWKRLQNPSSHLCCVHEPGKQTELQQCARSDVGLREVKQTHTEQLCNSIGQERTQEGAETT